jgi:hypothetical protein
MSSVTQDKYLSRNDINEVIKKKDRFTETFPGKDCGLAKRNYRKQALRYRNH